MSSTWRAISPTWSCVGERDHPTGADPAERWFETDQSAVLEADIARHGWSADFRRIRFWLSECRTPPLLIELARRFPQQARREARRRAVVKSAVRGDEEGILKGLRLEQERERVADPRYWAPLRRELERMHFVRARL